MSSKTSLDRFQPLLLIVIFMIFYCQGAYFKIKKVECTGNQNHFGNISCNLKPINWTTSVLNIECDVIGEVTDAILLVDIFYKDSVNLYKPFVFRFRYNICQLLDELKPSNFMERYVLYHLQFNTNLNHSCPYSGHLFARNFYLETISLPALPLQEYKVSLSFIRNNPHIQLGKMFLYFEAREDYRKKRP